MGRSKGTRRTSMIQPLEPRLLLAIVYVDVNAPGPTHDGASWETAYTDLQEALVPAVAGTEIRVADGTYKPTSGMDRAVSFLARSGVDLSGGYFGYGAADPDARDTAANATVFSGDIGTLGDSADNSYTVISAAGNLDGFAITGGRSDTGFGGGLSVVTGGVTVSNCTFIDNYAATYGGAVVAWGGSLTFVNCTFRGNSAGGAAIYGSGGAIYSSTLVSMTGCVFERNVAISSGGAIFGSFTEARNCRFQGNSALAGGALYAYGNTSPALTNCEFVGNTATTNSGGAIYTGDGHMTVTNCTLVHNSAGTYGGGLYSGGLGFPFVTNSVFWGNTAPTASQIRTQGTLTRVVVAYSDIEGGWTGTGNIDADPQFVRNPSPGGDGVWGTMDDDYGDLRLQRSSPCIDAGSNAAVPAAAVSDLAGNHRFHDIPTVPDSGSGFAPLVDIGAYEAVPDIGAYPGAPYAVLEGHSIALSGRGFSIVPGALEYDWDLDGDGLFGDASGLNPTFDSVGLSGGTIVPIALRVTDSAYNSIESSTIVRVAPLTAYVDPNAPGVNNGTAWANAFTSLADALAKAVAGQTIKVADGTYKPTNGTDRAVSFALVNDVELYGGYEGYGSPNPDRRNVFATPSILSGDIGIPDDTSDNSCHVVIARNVDGTTVLDGFTIMRGRGRNPSINDPYGSGTDRYGAGLYNLNASPTVRNCTFAANRAASDGGGVYNESSSPSFLNCVFVGNTAQRGGGVSNYRSEPTLINCTFTANIVTSGGIATVFSYSSTAALANCIVWANVSNGNEVSIAGTTVACSDIEGGWTGTGNIDADPQFVRNPSPGAEGTWGTADDDYGDLRLRLGSPCIDAGSNVALPSGVTTDLAGNPRFVDVPGVNDPGAIVDMGAYEYQHPLGASGSEFLFNAPRPSVRINFNGDVSAASVTAADLILTNITTGQSIDCGASSTVTYDANTRSATWAFSILLPDGNYLATLPTGSVSDTMSNPLAVAATRDFFVLRGDANRDRQVTISDLGTLASNWQSTNATWSQGDFNYDGKVTISDLGDLASNWQKVLAEPVVPLRMVATEPQRRTAAAQAVRQAAPEMPPRPSAVSARRSRPVTEVLA